MGLKIKWSYIIAIGLTAGIAGWMSTGDVVIGGESDSGEGTKPPAERVADADAKPFRVEVTDYTARERHAVLEIRGRTKAVTKVNVRAETAGVVNEMMVKEGDRVKKGDLLCVVDLRAKQSSLAQAQAKLIQAELDYDAAKQLVDKGFTSKTRAASLKAALDAAKALLRQAEWDIERTRITAPSDGIVIEPLADIGDVLAVNGVCATVVNPDPMLVTGQVSERQIGRIRVGMKARTRMVTGEVAEGTIRFIAPVADAATRTFRVEIEIKNPDGKIRDGVTASAVVPLEPIQAHLLSPAILALADDGRIGVRVVVDTNKVKFAPIILLADSQQGVWVAGLPKNVSVITVGQDYVTDGQVVEPVRAKTDKATAGKAEAVKAETGKAETGKAETGQ